jgi:hypothetical protein
MKVRKIKRTGKDVTFCKSKLTFNFLPKRKGVEYERDEGGRTISAHGAVNLEFNERSEVSNEVGFYGFNLPCRLER